jgi:hypothetical protein
MSILRVEDHRFRKRSNPPNDDDETNEIIAKTPGIAPSGGLIIPVLRTLFPFGVRFYRHFGPYRAWRIGNNVTMNANRLDGTVLSQ